MRLLLALLFCAPAWSAGPKSLGAPKGVTLPGAQAGPASSIPALPAALPSAAAASASGDIRRAAEMSAPKGAPKAAQAAPTAQAALAGLSAAMAAQPNQGGGASAAPLKAAFDGSFEKGSLEEALAAPAGPRVDLSGRDPGDTGGMKRKKAEKKLARDQVKLDELQHVLYADRQRKVLIVLQAMDTGGKDGTIRKVMRGLNPQGVQVATFKKPTDEEMRQHFLERVKKVLPGAGMIGVFNRSHYEDILVPTVLGTHPKAEVERRYDEINRFEKRLADEGWTILKFFLHISKDEQKRRLQARLDEPDKNWKYSPEDLKSRALWPKFQRVYEKILGRTSTAWAPWFIIPANNKWYRDYAVARILKRALKRLDLKYPAPAPDLPKTIPD